MNRSLLQLALLVVVASSLFTACGQASPRSAEEMSFFVTSIQAGNGGNMGGLAGADAHCQQLAEAVGSRKREWRAYLSASGPPPVHARDRIGRGPWFNSEGVQVAASLQDLHGANNNLGPKTALTELGKPIGYYHDMMTGSNVDGTLADGDVTCRNWTSTFGRAVVGHSNKQGSCCGERAQSWNSAHVSDGCSVPALQATGGAALFYCFAAD